MKQTSTKRKGFASMPIAKRKAVARRGGQQAHKLGKAHQWTSEQARIAGRKGGRAKKQENQS